MATRDPLVIVPLRDELVGGARTGLVVFLAAVGVFLLIACTNVAGLFLARAAGRQQEVVLRTALGATRGRLVQQFLTESELLALSGALAGLIVGWLAQPVLSRLLPVQLTDFASVTLNGRVLLFTLFTAGLATVLFGLAPALHLSRADLQSSLRVGGYRGDIAGVPRLHGALVTGEVTLALVLLVTSGLLLKSMLQLEQVDPGFRPDSVLTLNVALPRARYDSRARFALFYGPVLERIRALPGVRAAGAVNILPLTEGSAGFTFQIVGRSPFPEGSARPQAEFLVTTPDCFRTLGIPIIRGRTLTDDDRADGSKVVVISETMARRFWPTGDAIGAAIRLPGDTTPYAVIGVVRSVRSFALAEQDHWPGQMYFSYQQLPVGSMTLVVRYAVEPGQLVNAIRRAVAEVDPTVPLYDVRTMAQVIATTIAPQRLTTLLITFAGVLALLLAAVGVYGVMAQAVAHRTHEIGIRMALGASRLTVLRLVVEQGVRLTGVGLAIGLAGSWVGTRLLAHLLYDVSTMDVTVFAAAPLFVLVTALVACYVPARRAASLDPLVALRCE